jgi:hypothetical protein
MVETFYPKPPAFRRGKSPWLCPADPDTLGNRNLLTQSEISLERSRLCPEPIDHEIHWIDSHVCRQQLGAFASSSGSREISCARQPDRSRGGSWVGSGAGPGVLCALFCCIGPISRRQPSWEFRWAVQWAWKWRPWNHRRTAGRCASIGREHT